MKSKIGQITYCGYNFGSILQTYATQQLFLSYDIYIEYLNIHDTGVSRYIQIIKVLLAKYKNYIMYPQHIMSFRAMSVNARRKNLSSKLTDSVVYNRAFLDNEIHSITVSHKMLRKMARNDYDVIISGSDQIWNAVWYTVRKDYFLDFAPPEKRIAFAPSFGKACIADYNIKPYRKYLNKYRMLSVREKSGVGIIKQLTGRDAALVLDPTLLINGEQWLKLMGDKYSVQVPDETYILTYFIDKPCDSALESIRKSAAEGYKIIGFGVRHEVFDNIENYIFFSGGPWDFIKLYGNAHLIITDSFHGVAFAINFKKQFFVFRREYVHGSDQSERLFSILEICGLNDRFIDNSHTVSNGMINFDDVDKLLEPYKKESIDYVKRIVDLIAES